MKSRAQKAQQVTWVGFFFNLLLSIAKIAAGLLGKSTAMIADGIHSFSDFITDIIVILFIKVADKGCDEDHNYGHGKFETFATLLISMSLLFVGLGICWSGGEKIWESITGKTIIQPSYIALFAAILSIAIKEWLYRYTVKVGKQINNQAVIANAWHHRSDALSSIGTMLGIGGAIILGGKWSILDPIAGVVVSLFIMRVAVKLGLPSVNELLEKALPKETEKEILDLIKHMRNVRSSHRLRTRKIGNAIAIDIHVQMDRDISFVESHNIASEIEVKLRERFGTQTQINIHTEPFKG